MLKGKNFIVVKELATSKSQTGNFVTPEFDVEEIAKTLGDRVRIVDTELKIDHNPSKIYLILTCQNIIQREKPAFNEPIIQSYPVN